MLPCLAGRVLPLSLLLIPVVFAFAPMASVAADTYRVAATLPTGIGPGSLWLAPDGRRVVVANSDSDDLTVFSWPALEPLATIPVGRVPVAMAFDGAGAALVACFRDSTVVRVDLDRGEAVGRVAVPKGPRDIVMVDGKALVGTYYAGTVEVLDPSGPTTRTSIGLTVGVSRIVPVPGQPRALALNTSCDRVHVIDTDLEVALADIVEKIGIGLWEPALEPGGKHLLVSGWISNTVALVNTNDLFGETLIPTDGKGACQVAVAPDGLRAYVSHSESNSVAAIDLVNWRQVGLVNVGRFPFSDLAVSPDGASVLVTNDKDGTVSVIEAASMTVVQTIEVGSIPRHILFAGDRALVTCAMSNHLAVLERIASPGRRR
ncbi:MAG: hypothetical protein HY815_29690 [Candidatus Riflebacteria bacterium]|nr:hypothetical protein [Candidatus Riflebacteria bacterium]